MNKNIALIFGIIVLALAIGGGLYVAKDKKEDNTVSNKASNNSSEVAPNQPASATTKASLKVQDDPAVSVEKKTVISETPATTQTTPATVQVTSTTPANQ
jgi:hypothetical protein